MLVVVTSSNLSNYYKYCVLRGSTETEIIHLYNNSMFAQVAHSLLPTVGVIHQFMKGFEKV